MKKLLLSITALGLILFCGLSVATAENTILAKNALASTVKLQMDHGGYGSGFLVAPGRVATNLHVIHGAITGTAKLVGQKTDPIRIKGFTAIADEHDLVILEIPGLNAPPLSLGDSEAVKIGETVYAVGNPHEFDGTFSEGNISGIRKDANGKLLQITAPISPGSSGGPVLNKDGEVIGVSVAAGPGQNLNFAIPANYLTLLREQKEEGVTDLKEAGFRIKILADLFEWTHAEYPSYKFVLENVRREDAKNVYCLVTFLNKEKKIIGLDVMKVLKIRAGDTLHVTRKSIFRYETEKESEASKLMLSNKSNSERSYILSRQVINDSKNILFRQDINDYNFLPPHVRQAYKEEGSAIIAILGFDTDKSFKLIQDN